MAATSPHSLDDETEEFVARLARTAYDTVLAHGLPGVFVELELDLWRRLRDAVRTRTDAGQDAPHLFTERETTGSGFGQRVPRNAALGTGVQEFFV